MVLADKQKGFKITMGDDKAGFGDKWDTYKFFTQVQSGGIKDDITSDFVLASLDENQKEAIIELVRDAYFCKKEIMKNVRGWFYMLDKDGKYIRENDKRFKKFELDTDVQNYIKNIAEMTFNTFMIKILMTVILYRNKSDNVLVELIAEKGRLEEEKELLQRENETLGTKIKGKLKNREEEE